MRKNTIFRFYGLLGFFSFIFFFIILKIFNLQLLNRAQLKTISEKQSGVILKYSADRGRVFDTNKRLLATNITSYSIWANPSLIKDKKKAAAYIEKIVGIPKKDILFLFKIKQKANFGPMLVFVSVQLLISPITFSVSFISFIFWFCFGLLFVSLNSHHKSEKNNL